MTRHVNVEPQDSVRIQYTHKAVTIPASLIFSVDQNLKQCEKIRKSLIVYPYTGGRWIAECGGCFYGIGETAAQAIMNMKSECDDGCGNHH